MSAHICYIDKPSATNILYKKPEIAKAGASDATSPTADGATAASKPSDAPTQRDAAAKEVRSGLSAATDKLAIQLNAQLDLTRVDGVTGAGGAQPKTQALLQQYRISSIAGEAYASASLSVAA